MASQGPLYPVTVTTEIGPSGDNNWTNAANIGADDGSETQITASTYDAGDHSFRLRASNFGFTVPTGATIDGITVEIEQRRFAGAAVDQETRLFDETGTLVGDDKASATAWPGVATIRSYGGAADDWLPAGAWTPAQVNDPDFGVAHIVAATAANTDIGVDFIRVTVHYTPPAVTEVSGSDAGAGSDTVSDVMAGLSASDSGAGAETTATQAAFSVAETGAGSEATETTATFPAADSGTGAEGQSVVVLAEVSSADTGAASEAQSVVVVAEVSAADTGAASDAVAGIEAGLSGADSGAGAEATSIVESTSVSASDIAAASESAVVEAVYIGAPLGQPWLSPNFSWLLAAALSMPRSEVKRKDAKRRRRAREDEKEEISPTLRFALAQAALEAEVLACSAALARERQAELAACKKRNAIAAFLCS